MKARLTWSGSLPKQPSSAKLVEQHARYISQLEQLAMATGMQCMHDVLLSQPAFIRTQGGYGSAAVRSLTPALLGRLSLFAMCLALDI